MQFEHTCQGGLVRVRYGYDEPLGYYFIVAERITKDRENGDVFFSNLDFVNPRFNYPMLIEWLFCFVNNADGQLLENLIELHEIGGS